MKALFNVLFSQGLVIIIINEKGSVNVPAEQCFEALEKPRGPVVAEGEEPERQEPHLGEIPAFPALVPQDALSLRFSAGQRESQIVRTVGPTSDNGI